MTPMSLPLPAAVAVLVGLAMTTMQRRMRPALATIALTVLAAAAATAVVSMMAVVVALAIAQLPVLGGRLSWCRAVATDHRLPYWVAVTTLTSSPAIVASAGRAIRRATPARQASPGGGPLVVLPDEAPTAYAVAGRPGHVVVSAGMLRRLDAQERRALLAHERAHLELRHHRYLVVADIAAGSVPLLRPLRRAIRHATERWADERAARELGDRTTVARAICRAALAQSGTAPAMAMAGTGVVDRVDALLASDEDVARASRTTQAVTLLAAVSAVATAVLEVHHVARLLTHLCGIR